MYYTIMVDFILLLIVTVCTALQRTLIFSVICWNIFIVVLLHLLGISLFEKNAIYLHYKSLHKHKLFGIEH